MLEGIGDGSTYCASLKAEFGAYRDKNSQL